MKKEDLNNIIDGVANLLKVGLHHLAEEADTLAGTIKPTQPTSTSPRPTASQANTGHFNILATLSDTARFLDGDREQPYNVLGIRAPSPNEEPLVLIEILPVGWQRTRKLSQVLQDPVVPTHAA